MTSTILCIDPGVRGVGAALFMGGELIAAAYVRNPERKKGRYEAAAALARVFKGLFNHPRAGLLDELYIEFPRVYSAFSGVDNNDLLDITAVGAALAALFPNARVVSVPPSEWKGTVKKDVMTERIEKALTTIERTRVDDTCGKSLLHNVFDAVGIGLWKVNRLTKKVYPGAKP